MGAGVTTAQLTRPVAPIAFKTSSIRDRHTRGRERKLMQPLQMSSGPVMTESMVRESGSTLSSGTKLSDA